MEWQLFRLTELKSRAGMVLCCKGTEKQCRNRMQQIRKDVPPGQELVLIDPRGKIQELIVVRLVAA